MIVPPFALALQQSGSPDLNRTIAAGPTVAVVMAPPDTVCGSDVQRLLWTAGGRNLVVLRQVGDQSAANLVRALGGGAANGASRTELIAWNLQSRKARTVLNLSGDLGRFGEIEAMPGTENVVVEMAQRVRQPDGRFTDLDTISLVSAVTGAVVRINARDGSTPGFDVSEVSPTRPLVAIRRLSGETRTETVRFVDANGRSSPSLALPARAHLMFGADGLPGYVTPFTPVKGKKPRLQFHKIDPVTARAGAVVEIDLPDAPKPAVAPMVAIAQSSLVPNIVAPAIFLLPEGGKPEEMGVVSTDGTKPLLSPNFEAIAYVSQGSAMVRGLAKTTRALYEKAKLDAARTVALSKAKQVGLALMMYAADMDDVLPGLGTDVNQTISPYLRNNSLLEGFTYTFAGGDMSAIEKPAETTLGFVSGPGGRAMIYADGHVKWLPDTP